MKTREDICKRPLSEVKIKDASRKQQQAAAASTGGSSSCASESKQQMVMNLLPLHDIPSQQPPPSMMPRRRQCAANVIYFCHFPHPILPIPISNLASPRCVQCATTSFRCTRGAGCCAADAMDDTAVSLARRRRPRCTWHLGGGGGDDAPPLGPTMRHQCKQLFPHPFLPLPHIQLWCLVSILNWHVRPKAEQPSK